MSKYFSIVFSNGKLFLGWLLPVMFFLLVSLGFTGSSLGWYKNYPGAAVVAELIGERKLAGQYRGIRGDEFIAHGTPNAIAQYLADPQFPRKNLSLGLEGRDFLVLHDLGAPVKHFSMVFRPADWGFFLLPLRQALAFYWFCPIFLGMTALWLLMNRLFPRQEYINFILSAGAIVSPYAAGWSFWPVNNIYGLCFAALAVLKLAESAGNKPDNWKNQLKNISWALLFAWGLGCAALSLYLPRVIPAAYVLAVLTLAALSGNSGNGWKNIFSGAKLWYLIFFSLMLTAALLLWRYDAREAVESIRNSAYPGRRRMPGGSMALWEMLKGYLGFFTVYRTGYSNQSEMQSVLSVFLPWLILAAAAFRSFRKNGYFWTLLIISTVIMVYQFVGFPGWLAKITLFELCNPPRCAMALVLAQTMFFALLYSQWKNGCYPRFGLRFSLIAVIIAGGAAAVIMSHGTGAVFAGIRSCFSLPVFLVLSAAAAGCFLLVTFLFFYNIRYGLLVYAGANLLLGAVFNPVCIAPERVENHLVKRYEKDIADLRYGGRTLFASGNNFLAVLHFLSGGKSLNGYFMYPDEKLWQLFFSKQKNAENFRRMNHLDAEIIPPEEEFSASIPHSDRIKLSFPADYDFSVIPADVLAVPAGESGFEAILNKNTTLTRLFSEDGIIFYQIKSRRE